MSTKTMHRVRSGVPTGGQFAATVRPESTVTLGAVALLERSRPLATPTIGDAPDDGWQPPTYMPDSAVLHNVTYDQDRDGNVERVYCARCGEDVEDYDLAEAVEAGADPCESRDDW